MRRIVIGLSLLVSLSFCARSMSQDPPKSSPQNFSGSQEDIARSYKALEGTLNKIASKLERTGTKEGVEKSRIILRALQ
jgi:hypothetical protein